MVVSKKTSIPVLVIKKDPTHIILRTKDLQIGYADKKEKVSIASNVNFKIGKGELVAVIGINGVGKSTLLRSLTGIQKPLGGEVFLEEKPINSLSSGEKAQLISVVLTGQPISKNLNVYELIALGRQPYTNWIGTLTQKDQKFINEALELVDIENLKNKKCYELSDGQLQRVLIARALAQDTPLVVLDEPTTHLDIYHQAYVLKLLKELTQKTSKSIVFATHEINLALQLCDRIILMVKDKVSVGSPADLISEGAFTNLFPPDLIVFDKATGAFKLKT